jgi:ABC-type transport system involved in multi-copper enzyme maturation permease subunit
MKTIIRREFLDHVQSLQFVVLLAMTVILFAANGLIFVKSYSAQQESHQKQLAIMQNDKSTVGTRVFKGPNPLLFIAEGGDKSRPAGYVIYPKGTLSAQLPNPRTFKLPSIPPLDWSFIIGVLFSLYAILMGYNTISGEKELGTLRLVLSNPLGRAKLLAAKYVSILSVVLASLATGALISLIIIGIFAPQVLTLANASRVAFVLFLAVAYISLFDFLSLLFSALIPRPSLVLLALLAVWVLFAVVIPSTSIVLVEKLSAAPREIQTAKMFEPMIQKEVWAKINEIGVNAGRGEYKTEEDVKEATDLAFEEGQVKVVQFYENFERADRARNAKAKNLSRLSPAALFQYASEDIVRSGDSGEQDFLRQVREYSRVYDAYIQKKLGRVIETSEWSFSTTLTFNGKNIKIDSPRPREYTGDKSDFPNFAEQRPSLAGGFKNALGDLAGLVIWNILLAGLAFSAFNRTDVR